MEKESPTLSIVIPAKDEADSLGLVLRDLNGCLKGLDMPAEVIVVDDRSEDDTGRIARSYGAVVVRNPYRSGKGMALRCGFQHARGSLIVMLDGDYSHRAEDIPKFVEQLTNGTGLVIGSRSYGGSDEYTHIRTFGNMILSLVLNLLMGIDIRDCLNGFKGFRRELVMQYPYRAVHFDIEIELVINAVRAGYTIAEVPSHERARSGGQMKSRVIKHGLLFLNRILLEGLKYRMIG